MNARVVLVADLPNIEKTFSELYGPGKRLDYSVLRSYLKQDAKQKLDGAHFDFRARAFKQKFGTNYEAAFVHTLESAGWTVVLKPGKPPPKDLACAWRELSAFLELPGCQQYMQLLNADIPEARRIGRINRLALEMLGVYQQPTEPWRRIQLKLELRFLQLGLVRNHVHAQILGFWQQIGLNSIRDHRSELLAAVLAIFDLKAKYHLDLTDVIPTDLNDEELLLLAASIALYLKRWLKHAHLKRDVDIDITRYVVSEVLPDPRAKPRPALIYLVGDDVKNHLPIAERVEARYHSKVVLVVFRDHFLRMSRETRRNAGRYQIQFIEDIPGAIGSLQAA